MMKLLFLLLTVTACALLYLSHRHQAWLAQPLPQTPWRYAGIALLLLAPVVGAQAYSTAASVFAWLVISMLTLSLLPFFSLFFLLFAKKAEHGR